jgi:long-chain acyl-CoA synthetase
MFKNKINTDIIEILTGKFGGYEIPKRFVFLADDFTTENGMLTQTMKLKRRAVVEKYKKEIETQYI